MAMFPIQALHGYSLPRQNSVAAVKVERKSSRSFKTVFRRPSTFSRRGSKASRSNSSADGEIDEQIQSLFFARLPLEVRWQIYEEVLGDDIYHFRASKLLYHFRCPRGILINKAGRMTTMECDIGHPWIKRPMALSEARMIDYPTAPIKTSILRTCKLAYTEATDLLYRRAKFVFAGAEPLIMLGKTINSAALERIPIIELRAPDMLVWSYRVAHPRENRSGLNEWMECLALIQRMKCLRSLYVIVPNVHANFKRPERKHELETERDFLGRFSEVTSIPEFVVWIAWYEDGGEGYPRGDAEADRYAFKLVRFPSTDKWPRALPRSDEK